MFQSGYDIDVCRGFSNVALYTYLYTLKTRITIDINGNLWKQKTLKPLLAEGSKDVNRC